MHQRHLQHHLAYLAHTATTNTCCKCKNTIFDSTMTLGDWSMRCKSVFVFSKFVSRVCFAQKWRFISWSCRLQVRLSQTNRKLLLRRSYISRHHLGIECAVRKGTLQGETGRSTPQLESSANTWIKCRTALPLVLANTGVLALTGSGEDQAITDYYTTFSEFPTNRYSITVSLQWYEIMHPPRHEPRRVV